MTAALRPGGSLVTAHVHLLRDDPRAPGYAWPLPFGAQTFSEVLGATPGLRLSERIITPYYRIERYVREDGAPGGAAPSIVAMDAATPLPAVLAEFRPHGGTPRPPSSPETPETPFVPILMYHRVTPEPCGPLARWSVTPEAFAEQMTLLVDMGFHTITMDAWHDHAERSAWLPGRPCILTFDDGHADFPEHAWPVLQRHGLEANVFLPTAHMGGTNAWDARFGVTAPLMSWDDARALEAEGVRFGSHTSSHPRLTGLSVEAAARELAASRAALAHELTDPLSAIAYPFGDVDGGMQHLAGACGYDFALTCSPCAASIWDRPLALPRIEVARGASLAELLRGVL
jgi:peptidoglycan/xylan/chitin deacetylase (PgdA/CDA1 family)